MTSWDKKLGLLFLVALLFFSCEEEVGELNIAPENNLGIFFAEIPLEDRIKQVWAGSAPSSFNGLAVAGSYSDSVFGFIQSKAFADISLNSAAYDIETISSAELSELTLHLRITNVIGIYDENDRQKFDLFQLESPIENASSLTSASTIGLGKKVGEAEFNIYVDSIGLMLEGNVDTSRYDANNFYIYQTEFNLTDEYKKEFITAYIQAVQKGVVDSSDPNDVDSVSYFLDQALKGLAIVGDENNSAIITYNIGDTQNYSLHLDYTIENGEMNRVDQDANFFLNPSKSFNNIIPNESSPWKGGVFNLVDEINSPFVQANNFGYLMTGANMIMTIDLSDLDDYFSSSTNFIVQSAVLSINDIDSTSTTTFLPGDISILISESESILSGMYNEFAETNVLSELPTTTTYNADDDSYRIQIPLYLQGILNNKTNLNQIVIGLESDSDFRNFIMDKRSLNLSLYYTLTD